jgi:hypothetical protein
LGGQSEMTYMVTYVTCQQKSCLEPTLALDVGDVTSTRPRAP